MSSHSHRSTAKFVLTALMAASATVLAGAASAKGSDALAAAYQTRPFPGNCKQGCQPTTNVVPLPDGSVVGATDRGGKGQGSVYFIANDRQTLTTLHTFKVSGKQLNYPAGLVLASDGFLYGITQFGGTQDCGGMYRMAPDGTQYAVLHSFKCASEGYPSPNIVPSEGADGAIYAFTAYEGPHECGVLFKMTKTGVFTTIHPFGAEPDGCPIDSSGLMVASNGAIYGTTMHGGDTGFGTLFRIDESGYQVILSFDQDVGGIHAWFPTAPPTERGGALYGILSQGGTGNTGVVYKVDLDGLNYVQVHDFDKPSEGRVPKGGLLLASDGNLYGTASTGGQHSRHLSDGDGTIFSISPTDQFSRVLSFGSSSKDGARPIARLVELPDGTMAGTTQLGGTSGTGQGTVYWYTPGN
jgi:uncharacterized repeat protein (TIGR03803 family)